MHSRDIAVLFESSRPGGTRCEVEMAIRSYGAMDNLESQETLSEAYDFLQLYNRELPVVLVVVLIASFRNTCAIRRTFA